MCTKCTECENYSPDIYVRNQGAMFEIFADFANFPTQYILRIFNVANFRIQFPHFADFVHNFPLLATVRRFRTFPNPFHTLRRCCNLNTYFANSPLISHTSQVSHISQSISLDTSQIFRFRTFANFLASHTSQVSHILQSISHTADFAHFANFPHAASHTFRRFRTFRNPFHTLRKVR